MSGQLADVWEATFGFIDLSGFTALTDTHGDRQAIEVVDRFEEAVVEALGPRDTLVKTIGDGVLVAFADPAAAVAGTRRIFVAVGEVTGLPVPRAGLHHGVALARRNDVIGAAVNTAARIAGHAAPGCVLATKAVADAARVQQIEVQALGPVQLRNLVEPVELYDLAICPADDGFAIDPVCRMRVRRESPSVQAGDVWFCSRECAAAHPAGPGGGERALGYGTAEGPLPSSPI